MVAINFFWPGVLDGALPFVSGHKMRKLLLVNNLGRQLDLK
jgi:hypothetical protein